MRYACIHLISFLSWAQKKVTVICAPALFRQRFLTECMAVIKKAW